MLQIGVESCRLYRPKNWLVRQRLTHETTRAAHKVGFITGKVKASPRDRQGAWKISSSLMFMKGAFYLVLFVGEGSQDSGVGWSFNISL
jgi:hypothetical protein